MARVKHVEGSKNEKKYKLATKSMKKTIQSTEARTKGKNWSKEDEANLLKCCQPYYSIIECKKTDETTSQQRNSAWVKIHEDFNANASNHRTMDECKNKLTNIKRKLRAECAKHRSEVLKTGGGPTPKEPAMPSEEESALLSQIGLSVAGMDSVGDSDDLFDIDGIVFEDDNNNDFVKCVDDDDIIVGEIFETERIECDQQSLSIPSARIVTEKAAGPSTTEPFDSTTTNEQSQQNDQQLSSSSQEKQRDWSKYNPNQLRTPKDPALQLKTISAKSSNNQSQSIIHLRESEIKQKMQFERERHEIQMKFEKERLREQELRISLLETELEIKKQQLANQKIATDSIGRSSSSLE